MVIRENGQIIYQPSQAYEKFNCRAMHGTQGYTASGFIKPLLERELNQRRELIMGVKLRERPGKDWYVFIDWKGKLKAKAFGKSKALAKGVCRKTGNQIEVGYHWIRK